MELANASPTKKEIRKILDNIDIVYVGGGDTLLLVTRWQETGFDKLLKEYGGKEVVLSSLSNTQVHYINMSQKQNTNRQ